MEAHEIEKGMRLYWTYLESENASGAPLEPEEQDEYQMHSGQWVEITETYIPNDEDPPFIYFVCEDDWRGVGFPSEFSSMEGEW